MAIDKSKISATRFMFIIAVFLQSSSFLPSFNISVINHESWLTVVFAIIICIPLIYLFRTIMVMFPNKNLIQILRLVFGKVVGNIFAVLFLWFFITLTALNLGDFVDFSKLTVMYETPKIVLVVVVTVFCVYSVRNGFSVVSRYSGMFAFIKIGLVATSILLLFDQINLDNILPLFSFNVIKYVQSTHIAATIPIGELVILLMVTPNVHLPKKQATKIWFMGYALGVVVSLISLLRDTMVLGNTLDLFSLPALISYRLIHLGTVISRLEILFASGLIILLYFKVSLLLYITTIAVAEFFNLKDYKHLTLNLGILVVVYGLTLYPNSAVHVKNGANATPTMWTLFEIIIPLLILIVATARKLPKNNDQVYNKEKQNIYIKDKFKRRKTA